MTVKEAREWLNTMPGDTQLEALSDGGMFWVSVQQLRVGYTITETYYREYPEDIEGKRKAAEV